MLASIRNQRLITGILLVIFMALALYLRIWFPYKYIFGDAIKFLDNDPYYHMRIIDTLAHNFPNISLFDPYMGYPEGNQLTPNLFFDYMIAAVIWLVGLGHPTQQLIDTVSAYFPPVLSVLALIPVYYIGKELFNRWAGLIATGLLAILPGEFLGRSVLGNTDYHIAEVLFSTLAILFYIKSLRDASDGKINYSHIFHPQWRIIRKTLIFSLLSGIFLGLYILSWQGALFFVFILFLFLVLQFFINHVRNISSDYLVIINAPVMLIALISYVLIATESLYLVSIIAALIIPVVLSLISKWMTGKKLKPFYYSLTIIGLGILCVGIVYIMYPSLLAAALGRLGVFTPSTEMQTILEAQPIFFPGNGPFTLLVVWRNFTTGFFLSLISLGILLYLMFKRTEDHKTLFVVWCLVMLIAVIAQRRFSYYYSVNVALLTGCIPWLIMQLIHREPAVITESHHQKLHKEKHKKKEDHHKNQQQTTRTTILTASVVLIILLSLFNIGEATTTASQIGTTIPEDSWYETLTWMKDNTPPPFADAGFYYKLPGKQFQYPDSFYAVAAWWDYGYWITRIAQRVPNSNPGQAGAVAVGKLFTSQNETEALKMTRDLKSKYFIIDYATATAKFYSQALWAGSSKNNYYDLFYEVEGGVRKEKLLFYPAYYQSLVVRLYNFDASSMVNQNPMVINYVDKTDAEGKPIKEIISKKTFTTYREAENYVKGQSSGNYRIVGDNPFISPVTMPTLGNYTLVHSSYISTKVPDVGSVPLVKVFECTGYK